MMLLHATGEREYRLAFYDYRKTELLETDKQACIMHHAVQLTVRIDITSK